MLWKQAPALTKAFVHRWLLLFCVVFFLGLVSNVTLDPTTCAFDALGPKGVLNLTSIVGGGLASVFMNHHSSHCHANTFPPHSRETDRETGRVREGYRQWDRQWDRQTYTTHAHTHTQSQSLSVSLLNMRAAGPVFASKPNFLDGDPIYRSWITGMGEPNRTLDDTTLDVEPLTGASFDIHQRLQVRACVCVCVCLLLSPFSQRTLCPALSLTPLSLTPLPLTPLPLTLSCCTPLLPTGQRAHAAGAKHHCL